MAEFLTTREVAALLKVSRRQVGRLVDRGLPAYDLGGRGPRFIEEEMVAWVRGAMGLGSGPDAARRVAESARYRRRLRQQRTSADDADRRG